MNPISSGAALFICTLLTTIYGNQAQQLTTWQAEQDPQQIQQYVPQRAPISADLQNQVNALSAQLAAANRQLQYFQQQLSLASQQQPQQQQQQQQLALPQQQQQVAAAQPATPQQIAAQQFFAPQPVNQQQAPLVSTLVDGAELSRAGRYLSAPADFSYRQPSQVQPAHQFANQPTAEQQQQQQQQHQQQQQQHQLQQQQQQHLHQQQQQQLQLQQQQQQANQFASQQQAAAAAAATSTTVGPPSIEPSFQEAQPETQAPTQQQAPPANQAPPHNPPRNDDKFSIGLGVLSPGYTQKFGNTALDFNQDKNGFSFTLSNNGHNNQPPKIPSQQAAASQQPQA